MHYELLTSALSQSYGKRSIEYNIHSDRGEARRGGDGAGCGCGKGKQMNGKAKKAISILSVTALRGAARRDLTTFPRGQTNANGGDRRRAKRDVFRASKPIPSDRSPAERGRAQLEKKAAVVAWVITSHYSIQLYI